MELIYIGSIFAGIVIACFYAAVLEPKRGKLFAAIIFFCTYMGVTLAVEQLYYYLPLKVLVSVTMDIIVLRLLFRDSFSRICVIEIIRLVLSFSSEIFMAITIELIFHIPLMEFMMNTPFSFSSAGKVLCLDFFYVPLFVVGAYFIKKFNYRLSFKKLFPFIFFVLAESFTICYLGYLIWFKAGSIYGIYLVFYIFTIVLFIISSILLVRTIKEVARKTQLETENIYLLKQKEIQLQHYHAYLEQQKSIRQLRHDIINHVQTIKLLLAENNTEEADFYADKLSQRFERITMVDFCENKVIDAVLHNKIEYAMSLDIDVSVGIALAEESNIDDLDLMSVFSNLLDNAIEACQKSQGKKTIKISSKENCGFLVIKTENTGSGEPLPEKTSKKNMKNHGLGLSIIKEIAETYDGYVSAKEDNACYTFIVALKYLPVEPLRR